MSGQQIGSFVGGVIGAVFGGPYGYAIGAAIGGAVGGYIDPTVIKGPRLTDATAQTSQDGIPIPFGFGTYPTAGNIIWSSDLKEHKKEDDGKGTGVVNVTYTYSRSYAIGICQGVLRGDGLFDPIAGIMTVKRNGKVVYDVSPTATDEVLALNSKFLRNTTFYLGSEDQLPDPTIESYEGTGNYEAHRGLVYMVKEDEDLTQEGGAIPQWEFVVSTTGTVTPGGGAIVPLYAAGVGSVLLTSVGGNADFDDSIDTGLDAGSSATLVENLGGWLFHFSELGYAKVSFDNGVTWKDTTGLPTGPIGYRAIKSAIRMGSRVFAFPQDDSATDWYYTDDGQTFYPNANYPIGALSLPKFGSVARGNIGVVGQGQGYIGYTTDAGATWSQFVAIPGNAREITTVVDTGLYFVAIRGLSDNEKIIRSLYGGDGTWEEIDFPGRAASVSTKSMAFGPGALPLTGRLVVTLDNGHSIYSDDHGASWAAGADSGNVTGAHNSLIYSGGYFVGTRGGSYQIVASPDGTTAWSLLYNVPTTGVDVRSLAESNSACGGTAIPDAPGWFLKPDGSLCGPDGESLTRDKVTVGEIVSAICKRSGLTTADFDVSQLTDQVDGFKIATEGTAESFIAPLMSGFFFDGGEWDDKVRFVKRGQAESFSIVVDDLVERDGDAIEETSLQEVELLRKVNIKALDPAAGYIVTTQTAERRSGNVVAKGEQTTEIPVVIDHDTQAQMADKRLKVAWAEVRKFGFTLPYTRPELTVTDVGTITDKKGRTQRIRLMEVGEQEGRIEISECMLDRQSAYTSNVSGTPHQPPTDTSPGLIGPTTLVVMNIPILRDQDDKLGLYLAAAGSLSAWNGCEVQLSVNGGAFNAMAQVTTPSTIGYTESGLAYESGENPSEQTLDVYLPFAPSSTDYATLLRLNNRAAIMREDGSAHIIQYQTVTTLSPKHYRLSGLILGRYDTDTTAIASGATFVLIDSSLQYVQAEQWMIGQNLVFKPVSYGTSPDDAPTYGYTFTTAHSQTEWHVPLTEGYRDGSGDIHLSWQARGRLGTPLTPYDSSHFAGWRVTYSDGTDSFSYDVTDPTDTYTTAEQTADFGTPPVSLDISIGALNDITGEGPTTDITL